MGNLRTTQLSLETHTRLSLIKEITGKPINRIIDDLVETYWEEMQNIELDPTASRIAERKTKYLLNSRQ